MPYFYIFLTTDCHVEFDIAIAIGIGIGIDIDCRRIGNGLNICLRSIAGRRRVHYEFEPSLASASSSQHLLPSTSSLSFIPYNRFTTGGMS